jgi:DNA-binding MarR family transcriptional regulator
VIDRHNLPRRYSFGCSNERQYHREIKARPRHRRPPSEARRAELLNDLETAGRALGAAAVMFHTAVAAKLGMSATEEKALDVLDRNGPLTAKQLSQLSGLAPPSVTGLVDRLERKGFAHRQPDPDDGRRVLISANPARLAHLGELFVDWAGALDELYAGYTDEQLTTILHFMTQGAALQRQATTRLTEAPHGHGEPPA